jgi:hypothetical protein
MRELVEQQMEMAKKKKSKQVIDENGDVDFPVIRTVSILHGFPSFEFPREAICSTK